MACSYTPSRLINVDRRFVIVTFSCSCTCKENWALLFWVYSYQHNCHAWLQKYQLWVMQYGWPCNSLVRITFFFAPVICSMADLPEPRDASKISPLKGPCNTADKHFHPLLRAWKRYESCSYHWHRAALCKLLVAADTGSNFCFAFVGIFLKVAIKCVYWCNLKESAQ